MRKIEYLATAFLCFMFLVPGVIRCETTSDEINSTKVEVKNAENNTRNYTSSEKNKFIKVMKYNLAQANRSLDLLGGKINGLASLSRIEAQKKYDALRIKSDQLGEQLDSARGSTSSTWEKAKDDSKSAYWSLKENINNELRRLSNKTSP